MVSSIITMLSNIAIERWWTEATNSVQILTLLILILAQKLGDPARLLLYQPQLFMQDVMEERWLGGEVGQW